MVDLVESPLQLHCDNKSYKTLLQYWQEFSKVEAYDIKFLIINDKVWNHIVSVDNVSTILNITDPLVKRFSPKVFLEHISHMGMSSDDNILV